MLSILYTSLYSSGSWFYLIRYGSPSLEPPYTIYYQETKEGRRKDFLATFASGQLSNAVWCYQQDSQL